MLNSVISEAILQKAFHGDLEHEQMCHITFILSLGHKYPYERRTNNFLTIYAMVKNRSYGVRKGICDQGFMDRILFQYKISW